MSATATYTPWFQPPAPSAQQRPSVAAAGDRVDVPVYVYDEKTIRAVNVAGVTGRPLLVEGPSGCGKSSLAEHVAHVMDWDLYTFTVTSRTQAGDLLYRIDQLERLRDANAGNAVNDLSRYIEPGVLWEAFDKDGAAKRTASTRESLEPNPFRVPASGRGNGTVVLLDEIDKADPDVPNNLLLPLGSFRFAVNELSVDRREFHVYAQRIPLVILTTNNERRLPDAFLRRCVNLVVSQPDKQRFIDAGAVHFPAASRATIETIADLLLKGTTTKSVPSTAEYLDTVRACITLGIDPNGADWQWLKQITAWKPARRQES